MFFRFSSSSFGCCLSDGGLRGRGRLFSTGDTPVRGLGALGCDLFCSSPSVAQLSVVVVNNLENLNGKHTVTKKFSGKKRFLEFQTKSTGNLV